MSEKPLPTELVELEERLRGRTIQIAEGARERVLGAVGRELASEHGRAARATDEARAGLGIQRSTGGSPVTPKHGPDAPATWGSFWQYAAGLAAAAVLVINLSMAAAPITNFVPRPKVDAGQIESAAREIERSLPDLPQREAKRMALTMASAQQIVPAPLPRTAPGAALRLHNTDLDGGWQ